MGRGQVSASWQQDHRVLAELHSQPESSWQSSQSYKLSPCSSREKKVPCSRTEGLNLLKSSRIARWVGHLRKLDPERTIAGAVDGPFVMFFLLQSGFAASLWTRSAQDGALSKMY